MSLQYSTPPGSLDSSGPAGGYSLEIYDGQLDKKYLCGHCHLILREPMQSFCGHRFCKTCTAELLRNNEEVTCPACTEEGADGEFCIIKHGQIFPDNAMKREFLSWKVKCENIGCDWTGPFTQYEAHHSSCEFKMTVCACGRSVPASQLQQHLENECPARTTSCEYCQAEVPVLEKENHSRICLKTPVQCDECGKEMLREQLTNHYNGECNVRKIACPYGCGAFVAPDRLSAHEGDSVVEHVRSIHHRLRTVSSAGDSAGGGLALNSNLPVQVTRELHTLQTKLSDLERRVTTNLGDTSLQQLAGATGGASGGSASRSSEGGGNYAEIERKIMVLEEKVNAFENAAAVLENGIERGTTHVETVERNAQAERKNLEQRVKTLERSLAIKDVTTAELEQRIKTLEVASHDGVLVWKITDYAKKRQDAISGRTTSIYSPPFYTSRTGYKMCARMYLNGDGMGKGSYLSLFFVVMRNHYDALMRWPFAQKVTMILIDQNNRDHVIDAFKPDPSSSSFRKPMSEMNIASGCPLFCPIQNLNSTQNAYVKDDVMYIKIIVDTSDLNKAT